MGMNTDAYVFGVVKAVEMTKTKSERPLLSISIASIVTPVGEVERSRPLVATFPLAPTGHFTPASGWREEWYMDQLAKIAGPEAEVLRPWMEADPQALVDFFTEALMGRCFWWRVRYSSGYSSGGSESTWVSVDPLTPEAAGAALRGGAL